MSFTTILSCILTSPFEYMLFKCRKFLRNSLISFIDLAFCDLELPSKYSSSLVQIMVLIDVVTV